MTATFTSAAVPLQFEIGESIQQVITETLAFLPRLIAAVVILLIGDAIMRTRAATQTSYTQWFATGTRMFLYFTAIVIGLDTMGINVAILYVFARALAWGLAAAVALGAGIAIGWGGHTYVSDHIDNWMGQASDAAPEPQQLASTDGGTDDD